jgi:hydroxymethylpyrimidine pyrophosphatase-like HAD family hydrolase
VRYTVLASDYDGTLAKDGVVAPQTIGALDRFRSTGRRLVMVTGREVSDLESVFPRLDLFDCVVAENGAVLYWPGRCEKRVLAEPPSAAFTETLKQRGVRPLAVGDVIVATVVPNELIVLEVIRELGLELQIFFNKSSVMILPTGVNKMTGLSAALAVWEVPEKQVVGVGDAENDHAFLKRCGLSAAVANALPAVKETAALTMKGSHGAGVVELIEVILSSDPA